MGNKTYFLSDVHLGSAIHRNRMKEYGVTPIIKSDIDNEYFAQHEIERKLCRWLDMVKQDACCIYLLGDIFDYWFEYKNVVPRGFTRFLGKLGEVSDMGIEVHFFIGNHDIWLTDYLQKECGMIIHRESCRVSINGKNFFLAHGDGLGDEYRSFKIIRRIFHSKILRVPFAAIHPRWTVGFAHAWSNHSRSTGEEPPYMGEDKEHLILFAKEQLKREPDTNYFIFGHRHILLDMMISATSRVVILGDWIKHFSYGVFDGHDFILDIFEGEE